jgi:nucleotide-binding universal stress UspA family protein
MEQDILVATGGSSWSDAAMAYAMALKARPGSRGHIVTVLTASAAPATDDVGSYDLIMHAPEEEGQERLARAVAQAVRIGVDLTTLCSGGSVAQTMLAMASVAGCDLLLLGS